VGQAGQGADRRVQIDAMWMADEVSDEIEFNRPDTEFNRPVGAAGIRSEHAGCSICPADIRRSRDPRCVRTDASRDRTGQGGGTVVLPAHVSAQCAGARRSGLRPYRLRRRSRHVEAIVRGSKGLSTQRATPDVDMPMKKRPPQARARSISIFGRSSGFEFGLHQLEEIELTIGGAAWMPRPPRVRPS